MNETKFWEIIAVACDPNLLPESDWLPRLQSELSKLPESEIIEWDTFFEHFAARAYIVDLWGAAYLINGGASDDGFYYFRCWLIGMGRQIYQAALINPDTLVNFVKLDECVEAEIYPAARIAWKTVTGNPNDMAYPGPKNTAVLSGKQWDFDDDAEMKRRFPNLARVFLA